MDDFSINSEHNGQVMVVSIAGRIDSFTAATLDEELGKIVHENEMLVLDLNGVVYLSSAGVRSVVRVSKSAQKSGGGVRLARLPEHVADVLHTVGVMHVLQAHPSVEEAVASF